VFLTPPFGRLEPSSTRPIAVAVSGGGDSIFALRRTVAWANAADRPVVALHVDHGLQPQSAAWADFVDETAAALGASFRRRSWDGPKPARGLAAAARRARHRLLADAARDAGAAVIVTGHTADDALENQRLGQGRLTDWSPSPIWPEGRGIFLLRPLLGLRREDIRNHLRAENAAWIDDPTNDDPRQPRIAARQAIAGLFPPLYGEGQDEAQPRRRVGMLQTAPPGPADHPPHEGEGKEVADLARAATLRDAVIALPRDVLLAAPQAARRKVLASALVCAGGGERLPRTDALDRLLARLASGETFAATLCGARLEAAGTLTIMRDIGEAGRAGLRSGGPVWDGRYDATGVYGEIRPLKGLAASLPPAQRSRLRNLPPAARAALPVVVAHGQVTCPILAQPPSPSMASLVGARFAAACGALAREGDLTPRL